MSLNKYSTLLNIDLATLFNDFLKQLISEKYIEFDGDKLSLTHQGLFWGNNIINDLVKLILEKL